MADVYLSYANADAVQVKRVSSMLQSKGFSLSDPRNVPASAESITQVVEREIENASAMLVFWSPRSVRSPWVQNEATLGKYKGKLIPILLDRVEVPLGFGQIQALDLSQWSGDPNEHEWRLLVDTLEAYKRRAPPSPRPSRGARQAAQREYNEETIAQSAEEVGQQITFSPDATYKKPWRARSTAIFVAHASGDKPRIKPILEVLLNAGYQIWIDKPHSLGFDPKLSKRVRGIQFGAGDWKDQIRNAAHRANVVLAFWSNDAIDARREQFYYEVYMGLIQRKLCQCRIDDLLPSKIGMPFTFDQIADFSKFKAGEYHPELDFVIEGLSNFKPRLL